MKKELTVREALEQGYEHYMFHDCGDCNLQEVGDIDPDNCDEDFWDDLGEIELADKEWTQFTGMNKEELADLIAETIASDSVFTDSVSDDVYEALKKVDYSDIEKQIEDVLKRFRFKMSTGIHLVKESKTTLRELESSSYSEPKEHEIL